MTILDASKISLNGGTQSRAVIDREVVADYAEALRDGEKLPPIVVFHDGESHWLADGFHRVHAHLAESKLAIDADVRQGTRRDAILFSVGANSEHGLRRTNADKRRAVEMLLGDEEWAAKSDRWIAEKCGVHHSFVSRQRPELSTVAKRQLPDRTGQDGKVRRLPVKRSEERMAEKDDKVPPGESKDPRTVRFLEFTKEVESLLADGLGVQEIAERTGSSESRIHDAKRTLLTGSKRGKLRKNPLAGLTGFAIEFTDTWQDALPSLGELCAEATREELDRFLAHLDGLTLSIRSVIKSARKAKEKEPHEHEQVREAASKSD